MKVTSEMIEVALNAFFECRPGEHDIWERRCTRTPQQTWKNMHKALSVAIRVGKERQNTATSQCETRQGVTHDD